MIEFDEGYAAHDVCEGYLGKVQTHQQKKEILTRLLSSLTCMQYSTTLPHHLDAPKFAHIIMVMTLEGDAEFELLRYIDMHCQKFHGI